MTTMRAVSSAGVVLLLASGAVLAETAHLQIHTNQGTSIERTIELPSGAANVIVEFSPTAPRDVFTRFRRDLGEIHQRIAPAAKTASAIRYQYSVAYFGAAVTVPPATLERIRQLPYVRAVHRDVRMHTMAGPVVDFGTNAAQRVNASSLPTRGKGVVVAIIDTGIDYHHAALGGGFGPGFKVAGGYDFIGNDPDPMDDVGHGTHVAGILAADGAGLVGVAPDVTLIAYKVLGADGSGPTSGVIAAIERAVDPNGDGNPGDHVDIINLSLGGPGDPSDPGAQAVDRAVAAGVVVCAAAGNEGRTLSISSPGAAKRAITVAAYDEYEQTAFYSSKGPASKDYSFKPDIAAPGNLILSAKRGGGIEAMSGTSMAAPHVAGAAALLLALHPDWTPEDIKGAITGSARALLHSRDAWSNGAGALDVAGAAASTIVASESGISFGLNARASGLWDEMRTFRVTNRSARTETLNITLSPSSKTLTLTAEPAKITLEPGQSSDIAVHATADNATLEYPNNQAFYSLLTIAGSRSVAVPVALLRGARATVTFDRPFNGTESIQLFNTDTNMVLFPVSSTTAEAIIPAGQYDVVLQRFEVNEENGGTPLLPDAYTIIAAEDFQVTGESTLALTRDQAVHRFVMNALDDQGRALASRERILDHRAHTSIVRLNFRKAKNTHLLDMSMAVAASNVREVWVSPLSSAFTLLLAETYIDADARQAWSVAHPLRNGVTQGETFTSDPSQFIHATVRARHPNDRDEPPFLGACLAMNDTRRSGTFAVTTNCLLTPAPADAAFDVWATPDATLDAHAAIIVATGLTHTPPLRAINGSIVPTRERTVSLRDAQIPNHGTMTLGMGPFHPLGYPGTGLGHGRIFLFSGMMGPYDEWLRYAGSGGLFRMENEKGEVVASGILDEDEAAPAAGPGYHYTVVVERLLSRARWSRGTVDVKFGAGQDLMAPNITSLSVRNAADVPVDELRKGETATLRFSAGDFDSGVFPHPLSSKREATRAAYRISGTNEWHPLALTITGSETAERSDTGHWPAGDFYRADLTPATAIDNTFLDLRIELEDPAGNHLTWTHERALAVGTVIAPPPLRRRSVH